jgi:hypothetical protein
MIPSVRKGSNMDGKIVTKSMRMGEEKLKIEN